MSPLAHLGVNIGVAVVFGIVLKRMAGHEEAAWDPGGETCRLPKAHAYLVAVVGLGFLAGGWYLAVLGRPEARFLAPWAAACAVPSFGAIYFNQAFRLRFDPDGFRMTRAFRSDLLIRWDQLKEARYGELVGLRLVATKGTASIPLALIGLNAFLDAVERRCPDLKGLEAVAKARKKAAEYYEV